MRLANLKTERPFLVDFDCIIFVNVIICDLTVLRIKQFKIYGAQFIDMLL